jgi:hypothetical protein
MILVKIFMLSGRPEGFHGSVTSSEMATESPARDTL